MQPPHLQVEQVLELGRALIERVVFEPDLGRVLDELCRQAQQLVPGTVASIMLLGDDGLLHVEGGPDVCQGLRDLLDGLRPVPRAGSCGHAVHAQRPVFIPDLREQPEFIADPRFVEEFGVLACWSFPIRTENDGVVGSFALCSTRPREPEPIERAVLETGASLAGIAVERGRARAALERQRDLLDAIVASSEDPIFVKDLEGRYLLVNDAEARGIRDRKEDMLGRTDADLYAPDLADLSRRMDARVLASGESLQYVQEFQNPLHGRRTYHMRKTPLRDPEGRIVGLVGVAHDITDLQRAEEALRHSHRLGTLGALANHMVREFREVLGGLRERVEGLLASVPSDAPMAQGLVAVRDEVDRAEGLSREFLAQGREERSSPAHLDLGQLLREIEPQLRNGLPSGAELTLHLDPAPLRVLGRREQLQQLVHGLVRNSFEALAPGRGRVEVLLHLVRREQRGLTPASAPDPVWARLVVRDSGPGMEPETLASIFDPRFSTKGPGRGLGLTVLRGIVHAHGGTVGASSQVGVGTTLTVEFPASTDPDPRTPDQPAMRGPDTRRVLLCESEPGARAVLREGLADHGYQVLAVDNADDARRALAEANGWHAVVVDRRLWPDAQASQVNGSCLWVETSNDRPAPHNGLHLRRPFGPSDLVDLLAREQDASGANTVT